MRSCIKTRELTREVQNWIARVVGVGSVVRDNWSDSSSLRVVGE